MWFSRQEPEANWQQPANSARSTQAAWFAKPFVQRRWSLNIDHGRHRMTELLALCITNPPPVAQVCRTTYHELVEIWPDGGEWCPLIRLPLAGKEPPMTALVVCPHCGKSIKLRDRSLLGKKGKCPSCAKSFLLVEQSQAEEVIPLQLADEEPAVGTGARWVPDHPIAAAPAQIPVAYVPVQTPQGIVLTPVIAGQIPGYAAAPIAPQPVASGPIFSGPVASPTDSHTGPSAFDFDMAFDGQTASPPAARPATKRPVLKSKSKTPAWIGLALVVVALVAAGLYFSSAKKPIAAKSETTPPATIAVGEAAAIPSPPGAYSREALSNDQRLVAEFRPTHGEPIPLHMLTGTNNILIHIRPDRIWGTEQYASKELKASLTEDVVLWLESAIKKVTRRNPDQIEEMLIGISVVSKVEPPQISTVFRLKKPEKRSALVLEFNGEEVSGEGKPLVMKKDGYAFHVKDDSTIAICPADMGGDLSDSVDKPLDCVTDGIDELLKASDRERSVTIFMDVTDSLTYADQLFEPSAKSAMTKMLEWFGPDADTISWSLNLGTTFHSEVRVRPKGIHSGDGKISTPDSLRKDYMQRLPLTVGQDLVNAVRMMRPTQSGFRQIVGRFPAMVEAFRQATIIQLSPKFLTLTTVLPSKAAPNLALGIVLTWDESTRTNFSPSDPEMLVADHGKNLPKTVMGRLKTVFEIEFTRKPLQDAFLYIGEETQVNFVIDGDALKLAGYTKNIPQTFKLGKVPGTKGLHTILTWEKQEQMCLVVDDAKMEALITTTSAAEAKGLTVVPVDSLK